MTLMTSMQSPGGSETRDGPPLPGYSPFARLRALLAKFPARCDQELISLDLGEAQFPPPAQLLEGLSNFDGWRRYPPLGGTAALRAAYRGWLERRFGLRSDAVIGMEPTPGSKQAAFNLICMAVRRARLRGVTRPIIAVPNPFYPTYVSAAHHAGAECAFIASHVSPVRTVQEVLGIASRRLAAIVVCSPSNPEGRCIDAKAYGALSALARNKAITLIVDECYIDLFEDSPPIGVVSALQGRDGGMAGVVALHSLSKRSCVPGLRSGFVCGDVELVSEYADLNRSGGVSFSLPVCEVAASLWSDESHVARHRQAIHRSWKLADKFLGGLPGYQRAGAGFFLWIAVEDDERRTIALWTRNGLRVMPGSFLTAPEPDGTNFGRRRLRIALVHEPELMAEALQRLRDGLTATL